MKTWLVLGSVLAVSAGLMVGQSAMSDEDLTRNDSKFVDYYAEVPPRVFEKTASERVKEMLHSINDEPARLKRVSNQLRSMVNCMGYAIPGKKKDAGAPKAFCKSHVVGDSGFVQASAQCELKMGNGSRVPFISVVTCPTDVCEMGAMACRDADLLAKDFKKIAVTRQLLKNPPKFENGTSHSGTASGANGPHKTSQP